MATDKIPEMVERVARQLISALSDGQHDMTPQGIYLSGLDNDGECLIDGYVNFYQLISFVIQAMREPTHDMAQKFVEEWNSTPKTLADFSIFAVWRAMIDAALGE